MRHIQLLPIIHVMIYDHYNLENKDLDLDRDKLMELAEKHKHMLTNFNENGFSPNEGKYINAMVEAYGEFLDPDQYKAV